MGKILSVGVKDTSFHRIKFEYKTEVNLHDPNQLILILEDLINGYGAPFEKAFELYLKKYKPEKKVFPI